MSFSFQDKSRFGATQRREQHAVRKGRSKRRRATGALGAVLGNATTTATTPTTTSTSHRPLSPRARVGAAIMASTVPELEATWHGPAQRQARLEAERRARNPSFVTHFHTDDANTMKLRAAREQSLGHAPYREGGIYEYSTREHLYGKEGHQHAMKLHFKRKDATTLKLEAAKDTGDMHFRQREEDLAKAVVDPVADAAESRPPMTLHFSREPVESMQARAAREMSQARAPYTGSSLEYVPRQLESDSELIKQGKQPFRTAVRRATGREGLDGKKTELLAESEFQAKAHESQVLASVPETVREFFGDEYDPAGEDGVYDGTDSLATLREQLAVQNEAERTQSMEEWHKQRRKEAKQRAKQKRGNNAGRFDATFHREPVIAMQARAARELSHSRAPYVDPAKVANSFKSDRDVKGPGFRTRIRRASKMEELGTQQRVTLIGAEADVRFRKPPASKKEMSWTQRALAELDDIAEARSKGPPKKFKRHFRRSRGSDAPPPGTIISAEPPQRPVSAGFRDLQSDSELRKQGKEPFITAVRTAPRQYPIGTGKYEPGLSATEREAVMAEAKAKAMAKDETHTRSAESLASSKPQPQPQPKPQPLSRKRAARRGTPMPMKLVVEDRSKMPLSPQVVAILEEEEDEEESSSSESEADLAEVVRFYEPSARPHPKPTRPRSAAARSSGGKLLPRMRAKVNEPVSPLVKKARPQSAASSGRTSRGSRRSSGTTSRVGSAASRRSSRVGSAASRRSSRASSAASQRFVRQFAKGPAVPVAPPADAAAKPSPPGEHRRYIAPRGSLSAHPRRPGKARGPSSMAGYHARSRRVRRTSVVAALAESEAAAAAAAAAAMRQMHGPTTGTITAEFIPEEDEM